ncbi:mucin-15 [Varanus komodoensis]|uniref:mucin-15 n=1 Tax=Varanus komodoensis TaxID=61221 RepID=UPI001CF7C53D|nr:mucin-15 [Varanus komodoensis]
MLISKGMIVLFASLQWIGNNGIYADSSTLSISSLSSTNTSLPTSTVSLKSPTGSNGSTTKSTVTQNNAQSNSVTSTSSTISSSPVTHQQHFSTKDITHSSSSINGTLLPSQMPTTSSRLSSVEESYTTHASSTVTAVKNFTTTNSSVNSTTISPSKTEMNATTVRPATSIPNTTSSTLQTTKYYNATTEFGTSNQTTPQHKPIDSSAEAREPPKEKHRHGAVIFGAIIGAVLGSALIVLIVYFMCGQKKSAAFGHQRLYDDTRNDPVLRLDNIPEPYGTSFGEDSYYNPTAADETAAPNSIATPCDSIPMNDMTSSHPS